MDRKIRVGAVSYLNTKPLIYGLAHGDYRDSLELILDYPSRLAAMLEDNQLDLALLPVAAISRIPRASIISDYCIGCDGMVDSVSIFSQQPIEEIKTILLDYQSRTSVMLARILVKEYWSLDVNWQLATGEDYLAKIQGDTAGLVIGDRALRQKSSSPFTYDLGLAWKQHTGLPFVFACWVSNKQLPTPFIQRFNAMVATGFSHIEEIIAAEKDPPSDLHTYYTRHISYTLDEQKKAGMELFLQKLTSL